MAKMSDSELTTVISRKLHESVGYITSNFTAERDESLRFYLGEPFGNEVEGQSQVISRDVMDTIEWIMPSLMEMFHGSDQAVEFEPVGPEDEEYSEQATDLVNHIYLKDNNGFLLTYTALKDGLLQNLGVVKHWCETETKVSEESYTDLAESDLADLVMDDEVQVVEQDSREEMIADPMSGMPVPVTLYDVKIKRTTEQKRFLVQNVQPEEFVFEPRMRSLDDKGFMAHVTTMRRSELIEAGYDDDVVRALPAYAGDREDMTGDRDTRYEREDALDDGDVPTDPSMDEIEVAECVVWIDYDGDGIAERRKILVAGNEHVVLDNVALEEDLFTVWSPIILPHSLAGLSVADTVKDLQYIKSTLWRQMLDGLYLTNNPTKIVHDPTGEDVNYDDLLSPTIPGKVYRTKGAGIITPQVQQWPGAQSFPMLEYLDRVREQRAGVSQNQMGINPDLLQNQTATAVNQAMTAAQARIGLIARIFAEQFMRRLFRALLRLVVRYQDKERTIRLRSEWVPIDPRSWNADMDVTTNVGLGTGNKDAQMAILSQVLMAQKEALAAGGLGMVTPKQIYNTLKKMTAVAGFPSADPYFVDPESQEGQMLAQQAQQNQQPDPNTLLAMAEMRKAEADTAKVQADAQKAMFEAQVKATELDRLDREFRFKVEQATAELALKARDLGHEINLDWAETMLKAVGNGQRGTQAPGGARNAPAGGPASQ